MSDSVQDFLNKLEEQKRKEAVLMDAKQRQEREIQGLVNEVQSQRQKTGQYREDRQRMVSEKKANILQDLAELDRLCQTGGQLGGHNDAIGSSRELLMRKIERVIGKFNLDVEEMRKTIVGQN